MSLGLIGGNVASEVSTRPGIWSQILGGGLNTLSTIGHVLDTPASVVRGLAGGVVGVNDWERAFTGIFSIDNRVTGTELLGGEKDEFTWRGLGLEILTDPLTYVTLGAKTAVGETAKRLKHLEASKLAQQALSDNPMIAKKLAQTEKAIVEVEEKLRKLNYDPALEFGATRREQWARGQRALFQFDLPFTSINTELVGAAKLGTNLGSLQDTIAASVSNTKVAKDLRERFIQKQKNPKIEAMRQEFLFLERQYKAEARERIRDVDVMRKKVKLATKDPDIDKKVAYLVENFDEELGGVIYTDVSQDAERLNKYLKARVAVEEHFGKTDKFDDVWVFAQQVRAANLELLDAELKYGVPVEKFTEFGYLARIITPKGAAILRKSSEGQKILRQYLDSLDLGRPQSFQFARQNKKLGLSDLNKKLLEEHKKAHKLKDDFQFFDTDIVSIMTNRMLASGRAIGRAKFAQAAYDMFGENVDPKMLRGEYTDIAKVLRPRGGLVTNTKLRTTADPQIMVDYLTGKRWKKGNVKSINNGKGIRLGPWELWDINKDTLKKAVSFKNSSRFRKLSEGHAEYDQMLNTAIQTKELSHSQAAFLRMFAAQISEETLRARDQYTLAELKLIKEGKIKNRRTGTYELDEIQERLLQDMTFPSTIGLSWKGTNVLSGRRSQGRAYQTFMHEFAHLYHLSNPDENMRKNIDTIADQLWFRFRKLGKGKKATIFKEYGNKFGFLRENPGYFMQDPHEYFAEMFVRWTMNERIVIPDEMKDYFKNVYEDYKTMRELYQADKYVYDYPDPEAQAAFESLTENLNDIYLGIFDQDQALLIDKLQKNDRTDLLNDFAERLDRRTFYLEIKPDDTAASIRRKMRDNGVEFNAIPTEVAEFAEKFLGVNKYALPYGGFWSQFIGTLDEVHALYKTALTQYFPAFHVRNFISNIFMNAMAGIINPSYYINAHRVLKNMTPEDRLYYASLGVIDSGKSRDVYEFMQANKGALTKGIQSITGETGKRIDRLARESVGYSIENHTRLAHFLGQKAKGLTDTEAAESVIKYLFDYDDLTDFEKAVPRRAMLFYTFMRKNIPLMMSETFRDPRFMMTYLRATGQTNPNIQQPEWLPDSFFFGEDEQGRQIRVNFGLPPEDLARFDPEGKGLARVFELLLSSTAPTIREPYQFISGRDTFLGKPMEGGLGERLLAASPASRFVGTGSRISQVAQGEIPNATVGGETLRFFTGVNPRPIDSDVQEQMNELSAIRARLDELVRSGKGRKIEIVGQRRGMDEQEIRDLNSRMAEIHARLREQFSQ